MLLLQVIRCCKSLKWKSLVFLQPSYLANIVTTSQQHERTVNPEKTSSIVGNVTVVFSRFFLRSVSWASQFVFLDNCYELLVNKAPLAHETLWHFKLWILLMGEESKTHDCFSCMTAQRHARCLRWFGRSSYTHWGQGVQIENLMSFDPWILNLVNEGIKSTPTLSQEKKNANRNLAFVFL
jgi:hypothetical protein